MRLSGTVYDNIWENGVQFSCNTCANFEHECKLQMVSNWLKTKKKTTRTNQIRAVFTTKL